MPTFIFLFLEIKKMSMTTFYTHPIPGIPIYPPENAPSPTDHLVGYRLVKAPATIFCKPDPRKMTSMGWLSVALTGLIFWPLSCVPCCLSSAYGDYQVPVYE
jgi:hypothetical protein